MNKPQMLIAVFSGIVVTLGFILVVFGSSDPYGHRLLVGIFLGIGVGASMIRHPNRVTLRRIAFMFPPFLGVLIAYKIIYDPARVIPTVIWALVLIVSQVAFLMAGTPNSGRAISTHSK